MPKLSKQQVIDLITLKMTKCSDLQHHTFMELAKLYIQLTAPSQQKKYRERKKIEALTVRAAQQAVQTIKPAASPSVTDIVREIEQQQKQGI
jgi:hypothetical protein